MGKTETGIMYIRVYNAVETWERMCDMIIANKLISRHTISFTRAHSNWLYA